MSDSEDTAEAPLSEEERTVDEAAEDSAPDHEVTPEVEPEPESVSDAVTGPDAEPEPGAESESETGAEADPEAEPDASSLAERGVEPEPKPVSDAEPEPEPVSDAEPEPDVDVDAEPEPVSDAEPDADVDVDAEPEPEPVSDAEPDVDVDAEPEPEPESEPGVGADAEAPEAVASEADGAAEGESVSWSPQPWETAPALTLDATSQDDADVQQTLVMGAVPPAEPEPGPELEASVDVEPTDGAAEPSIVTPDDGAVPTAPVRAGLVSPLETFPAEPRVRRWPRTVGRVAAGLVVLGGAYVGAQWFLADRVPTGTVVAGVEIGGLDSAAAVSRLDDSLAAVLAEPIPVAVGDQRTALDPKAAGLAFDAAATVRGLTGFGLEPSRLWRHMFGAGTAAPVTTADAAALKTAVTGLADALDTTPVDGTVAFVDGAVSTTAPIDGVAVDVPAASVLLTAGWLTAPRPIALPTSAVAPTITQDAVDRAVNELAQPLSRAPVSVAVDNQVAELPVKVLTDTAHFTPEGSDLVLSMDGPTLVDAIIARTRDLITAPSDATFTFQNDAPVLVPGVPGTTLDPTAVAEAVAAAATADNRTAHVQLVEADPLSSTEALKALGITEIVSEFSTPLTSEPHRTGNITVGAAAINGTLVRPGETFSLTDAIGRIDAAHGFVEAGAIINGEHSEAWGGGLSQLSTTTYNASFFAGFKEVEHTAHSEWFARYPAGREATIFTGLIDLKWLNDTPYGALVQSWVADGRVHVRIWGTKYWTVATTSSGWSNIVQPTTVYSQSPTCQAQRAGNPGFTITVTRTVSHDGEEHSHQSWTTRYKPQNTVVCGPAPTG